MPSKRSFLILGLLGCFLHPGTVAATEHTRTGISLTADWVSDGEVRDGDRASTVATAGDVNGDGFSDVIVGADGCMGSGDQKGFDRPLTPCHATIPGRALLYLGSASGLFTTVAWAIEGTAPTDRFGYSVATAGDVNGDGYGDVIVGVPGLDNNAGGVFLYLGSLSGLSTSATVITAPIGSADQLFGHSVATAGDVNGDGYSDVVVGGVNVAFLYLGSASGVSTSPAWDTGTRVSGDWGVSVATAGDVDGDSFSDVIVAGYNGAFLYRGSAAGLPTTPDWSVDLSQYPSGRRGLFVSAVATAGDVNGDGFSDVIVGQPHRDEREAGTVFVYCGSETGLSTSAAWTASDLGHFGASVATAGDADGDGFSDIIIGAPGLRIEGVGFSVGQAAVYFGASLDLACGGTTEPAATLNDADWTATGENGFALLGTQVATAGDVDRDGFSDIIVGSPGFEYDPFIRANLGRGYVYSGGGFGPAGGPVANPCTDGDLCPAGETGDDADWDYRGSQVNEMLGSSVVIAGDVNADGYSDVVVGAPGYDANQGRALLFLGSASGLSGIPDLELVGDRIAGEFGTTVAAAGDVNGDGFSDAVVDWKIFLGGDGPFLDDSDSRYDLGASEYIPAGDVNGDGFGDLIADGNLRLGSDAGFVNPPTPWSAAQNALGIGDVNGDGYDDVVGQEVGIAGAALYLGSAAGLSTVPVWREQGRTHSRWSAAGDVNGDGFSDVMVHGGVPILYLGSAGGLFPSSAWSGDPNASSTTVWNSNDPVAAGDVNGDGFSEVIIGQPFIPLKGGVFLFSGSSSGLSGGPLSSRATSDWAAVMEPERRQVSFTNFGRAVASGGDVNGDGFSDVIVGAPTSANSFSFDSQGRVFAFHGGNSNGPGSGVRQRTGTGAPIALGGVSDSAIDFRIELSSRNPGADNVRYGLEWEVARRVEPLDGSNIQRHFVDGFCDGGATSCANNADCATGETCRFVSTGLCSDGVTSCSTNDECGILGFGGCRFELATSVNTPVSEAPFADFYHWRARVITSSPFFPGSPWVSVPGNNVSEKKIRTSGDLAPFAFALHGPIQNERLFANSSPLTFSWRTGGASEFRLEWSRNPEFGVPLVQSQPVVTVDPAWASFLPDESLWREILGLVFSGGFQPDSIFWRVVRPDGTPPEGDEDRFRVLRIPVVQTPTLLSPANGAAVFPSQGIFPTFVWDANSNERYQIRFSDNDYIGEPRVTIDGGSPDGFFEPTCTAKPAPLNLSEVCELDLTVEEWTEIEGLTGVNGGTVYYVVLARDALGRTSFSRVMSLQLIPSRARRLKSGAPEISGGGSKEKPGRSRRRGRMIR